MKKERLFFEAGSDDIGLQVTETSDGKLCFSANNEWCGSTETGFGATVTVDINKDDAQRLLILLTKWLNS